MNFSAIMYEDDVMTIKVVDRDPDRATSRFNKAYEEKYQDGKTEV